MKTSPTSAGLLCVSLALTIVHVHGQDYVTRSETESIARSAAEFAAPSADAIASAVVKKQEEEKARVEILQMSNEALTECRAFSALLKANKEAAIPKATFAKAREALKYATAAAPAARSIAETDLAKQLDDAAYELNILILSLDKDARSP